MRIGLQVGTNSKKCLRILPANLTDSGAAGAAQQKVAVAGHNGVLLCFSRKKTDSVVSLQLEKRSIADS